MAGDHHDVNATDFRHLVDIYAMRAECFKLGKKNDPKVQGIRINYNGDRLIGRPPFKVEEDISRGRMIVTNHEKPDIARRIDVPLLTSRVERDSRLLYIPIHGVDSREEHPYGNKCANVLHIDLDSKLNSRCTPSERVDPSGRGPMRSDLDVGPILVPRQDRKPLHSLHFEAICYCLIEVMEDIAQGRCEVYDELRYAYVMVKISKESFMKVWCEMLDEKRGDDSLGVDEVVKSPYEV